MNIEQERKRLLIELAKAAAAEGKREESLAYLRELHPKELAGTSGRGMKKRSPKRVDAPPDLASLTGGPVRK